MTDPAQGTESVKMVQIVNIWYSLVKRITFGSFWYILDFFQHKLIFFGTNWYVMVQIGYCWYFKEQMINFRIFMLDIDN